MTDWQPIELLPENRIDHRPEQPESPGIWWRYHSYCEVRNKERKHDSAQIYIQPYTIIRETEASVWIDRYDGAVRIQKDWNRKWAYPTKAEAWAAWTRRWHWRKKFHEQEARRIVVLEMTMKGTGND